MQLLLDQKYLVHATVRTMSRAEDVLKLENAKTHLKVFEVDLLSAKAKGKCFV